MKKESESVIQQQIYNWINNTYCLKHHEPRLLVYSVPNGSSTGDPKIIKQMTNLGMVKGISDLKLEGLNGRVVSVEVKTSTGIQSKEQKEIQACIEKNGGRYLLVRSLLDAQLQINKNIDWILDK